MKIYVASSWRNLFQPAIVEFLRGLDQKVYDFRNPEAGNTGFRWTDIDPDWQRWTPEQFVKGLEHPVAKAGFKLDLDAMRWADACVLLMPCGRSAHLEAGWFIGANKPTAMFLSNGEPELMYKLASTCVCSTEELKEWTYKTSNGLAAP